MEGFADADLAANGHAGHNVPAGMAMKSGTSSTRKPDRRNQPA